MIPTRNTKALKAQIMSDVFIRNSLMVLFDRKIIIRYYLKQCRRKADLNSGGISRGMTKRLASVLQIFTVKE